MNIRLSLLTAGNLHGLHNVVVHFEIFIGLVIIVPEVLLENSSTLLLSVILHDFVFVALLGLELDHQFSRILRGLGLDDEVIVAMRAVFVSFLKLLDVFAENLSAFLACEDHLGCPFELMILSFVVTLRTVEPFPAAGSSDSNLGVENVLTHLKFNL